MKIFYFFPAFLLFATKLSPNSSPRFHALVLKYLYFVYNLFDIIKQKGNIPWLHELSVKFHFGCTLSLRIEQITLFSQNFCFIVKSSTQIIACQNILLY